MNIREINDRGTIWNLGNGYKLIQSGKGLDLRFEKDENLMCTWDMKYMQADNTCHYNNGRYMFGMNSMNVLHIWDVEKNDYMSIYLNEDKTIKEINCINDVTNSAIRYIEENRYLIHGEWHDFNCSANIEDEVDAICFRITDDINIRQFKVTNTIYFNVGCHTMCNWRVDKYQATNYEPSKYVVAMDEPRELKFWDMETEKYIEIYLDRKGKIKRISGINYVFDTEVREIVL